VTNGFSIEMQCPECGSLVSIAYRATAKLPWMAQCAGCGTRFGIESSTIARQIKLFIDLCHQLKASEEILANAAIAITVGSTEVKIPFRLLLTRLKSTLELDVGGKKISIASRTEPLKIGAALAQEEFSGSSM
jgi:transcription elongation factor Elf1